MALQLVARRVTATIKEKDGTLTCFQIIFPSPRTSGDTVDKLRWALEQTGFDVSVKNEWTEDE
jgi:hypothetical protein